MEYIGYFDDAEQIASDHERGVGFAMSNIEPFPKKKRLKSIDEIEGPIFKINLTESSKNTIGPFALVSGAIALGAIFGLGSTYFF